MRILLVEDDDMIGESVVAGLECEGHAVDWVRDGNSALLALNTTEFSLVILDLGLPGKDGLQVLKEMRAKRNATPVLVTTARDTVDDRIRGLDMGADDYLIKPYDLDELSARIRALLRRANAAPQQKQPETLLLTAGGITLDPEQRVAVKNGEIVELTAKEYDLIELLVKNPRRVYSRENLMDLVWGYTYAGDYRTVDVHIRRLREKLEENPAAPQHILTKWGVGYYLKD